MNFFKSWLFSKEDNNPTTLAVGLVFRLPSAIRKVINSGVFFYFFGFFRRRLRISAAFDSMRFFIQELIFASLGRDKSQPQKLFVAEEN